MQPCFSMSPLKAMKSSTTLLIYRLTFDKPSIHFPPPKLILNPQFELTVLPCPQTNNTTDKVSVINTNPLLFGQCAA